MPLTKWKTMEVKDLPQEIADRYRKSDRDWRIEQLDTTDEQDEIRFLFEDMTKHVWFMPKNENKWVLLEAPPETNI